MRDAALRWTPDWVIGSSARRFDRADSLTQAKSFELGDVSDA
jgi:hypothetical protein